LETYTIQGEDGTPQLALPAGDFSAAPRRRCQRWTDEPDYMRLLNETAWSGVDTTHTGVLHGARN
jgi:hypothetical protein